jgi:hypothetical protein
VVDIVVRSSMVKVTPALNMVLTVQILADDIVSHVLTVPVVKLPEVGVILI